MARRPTIAGVVLTLNEERDLARALQSLSWCDELFVVDSGSTDSTQSIGEKFNARFLKNIQDPPFRITDQRNWLLRSGYVSSDWVLFLDADEEVGLELQLEIVRRCTHPGHFNSFNLTPRYWFLGKWLKRTQGYPNWHPRLLRNGQVFFVGGVWESFSLEAVSGRIYYPYEHYAFSKGLLDWIERHYRYASWDANATVQLLDNDSTHINITPRFRSIRMFLMRLWWAKPILRFFQKYFINLGFIEGPKALLFSLLMSFYEIMVIVRVIEIHRTKRGLSL